MAFSGNDNLVWRTASAISTRPAGVVHSLSQQTMRAGVANCTRAASALRQGVGRRAAANLQTRAFGTAAQPQREQDVRPYEEIPGPKTLPLVGNYWRMVPGLRTYDFDNFPHLHQQLHAEFGDVVRFGGLKPRNDLLFVYRPEDMETVFRNEGVWPMRPAFRSMTYYRKVTRKDFFKGYGGVLNDQGKAWHEARSQVNPVLMQTRTAHLYAERINQVAEDFVTRIPEWRDEKNQMPATFGNEIHKWALESIALIALDTRLGCLAPQLAPLSEPQRMIDAVHTMFACLHTLEVGGFMWTLVSTPTWRKFVATMDYFVEVSMKYIQVKMDQMKVGELGEEASVLERVLARDPNPTRAVIMVLDMLMAGVDTTSHSVANFLLHLSANPEQQEKLHDELRRVLPSPDTPISAQTLEEFKYLRACVKESMRLQPIATGNARTTQSEIVLSNYRVPKGVDIVMGNGFISRMDQHFPEANKFKPERWLREKDGTEGQCPQTVKTNPFVSLPFGFGARKCVGFRMASLELEMVLAKLVRRYRWEFLHPEMRYRTTIVHTPVDPLRFTVHLRDE